MIVLDDADLDIAVDGALFACMLYSGQICESGTRLLVPTALHDEFVERLVARASTIKLGDPADFDTDMGPVVSARQRDRILEYLRVRRRARARRSRSAAACPRATAFERGFWIEPTIFTDVDERHAHRARGDLRAGARRPALRRRRRRGGASRTTPTTGSPRACGRATTSARSRWPSGCAPGTVWINNWHMIDPALPFGGYKQSGVGRELGPDAIDEYTETKHIHVDLTQSKDRHLFDVLLSTPGD